MVSLWPWKGEDTSPASFEKALSSLAAKITQSQTHLDSLRSNNRRIRALVTLYSIFAYILCISILFLVVGWQNWTALEYTAVAGSPLVIYLARTAITAYYNYRIDNATKRLEDQQASRAKKIDQLKAATKYNSTQELLEKYGGAPPKPKQPKKEPKTPAKSKGQQQQMPGRTGTGPPPTANIQRPGQAPSQPSTPQPQIQPQVQPQAQIPWNRSPVQTALSPGTPQAQPSSAEFAPNAFSSDHQPFQSPDATAGGEAHWYDRVLDLLMGEDETSPKNRIALICQQCRVVNGQASPGIKSLAELGKWRCFRCGAWNGEEDEATKVVQEMKEKISETQPLTFSEPEGSDVKDSSSPESENDEVLEDESAKETVEAKHKRGRPKGNKTKA